MNLVRILCLNHIREQYYVDTSPQDELLEILALYVLSQSTSDDILAEYAWSNAIEKSEFHGLKIDDAI